ncbi:GNAT family N-acetyltransferase [Desulfomonile tiedjei]|uniref:Putative acetyltransferase, GNAT superfamily n=1 Tax=Desulfomonile tiedjei (strain ATCC 49306 / DSM 6799 / DCB-1) TaxID=706587 RepID=I4C8G8_DESTA|nr:GNAT family N-acetyltransferase [Desulfomonile tiedjei]AFM25859.1 putative acetyltransferase, GNAT superfamily [Desulfomonile tiedjei DSM 6799]
METRTAIKGAHMNATANIEIRNGKPSDHQSIVSVMPDWWGGRDLSSSVLKIFFIHFADTTYVAEIGDDLIGFLVGFLSQSDKDVGYIHFMGVHPEYRRAGVGRRLYQRFYDGCAANDRPIVKSCTSPINKLSIAFHLRMGFEIEPGDGIVDGVPVTMDFLRANDPKVLFRKELRKK